MADIQDPDVQVDRGEDGRVVQIRHRRQQRYSARMAGLAAPTPVELAEQYIRDVAEVYEIASDELTTLAEAVAARPVNEKTQLRRWQEKSLMETTVVAYQQTHRGLPVWNSSISVLISGDPPQVTSSNSALHPKIDVDSPPLTRLRKLARAKPGTLKEALGITYAGGGGFSLNGVSMLVYAYDPEERFDPATRAVDAAEDAGFASQPTQQAPPVLPLPPVPDGIEAGRHYVVQEILFKLAVDDWGELNWRAFVEPETGAVLYLRALTAAATCCVFLSDPRSPSGAVLSASSPEADLNDARALNETLLGLDATVAGVQHLKGEFARALDTDPPTIAPPTETSPFDFCYSAITDDFAAANGYFHHDAMYRMVEDFGFAKEDYFDGTTFPVPVDHRGMNSAVNARADGNATGTGMEKFQYGLVQSGQPVGIASAVRVCLHEFGHALLWDHVHWPNFGWCHSAGDSLAAILHDRGPSDPNRFVTFPFPDIGRRHNRSVADGWAFGGRFDDRGYGSEQILSTLLFRIYRVAGGDSGNANVRAFAARYLAFLIIKAIGLLTATTTDPRVYVSALMDADETTGSFEGHPGGAWHKLFRWSFEKQGLYQPSGAPSPVTQPGAPPPVDVYIDDGRDGDYEPYQPTFDDTPGVWNRLAADGDGSHQPPAAGTTNYLYARVENRGTQTATNVVAKAYQASPSSNLRWPGDFQPLSIAQVAAGSIGSNAQKVVGPFQWTPVQGNGARVLVSVSAAGDSSNADTVSGALPSAHLAMLDNNVARRDMGGTGAGIDLSPILSLLLTDDSDEVPPGVLGLLLDD